MRNVFIEKLMEASATDCDIILLTSDLGYNAFEPFRKNFPNQFINVGVAENNMVGIGSGLALKGKKVFIYSIIPFLIFRCYEQIRNIICYNNLNVKLLGAGGGFSYGNQGVSHNATEDLSVVRNLPNITMYSPGTKTDVITAFDIMLEQNGPSFIRLGKAPEINLLNRGPKYSIGDGTVAKDGHDILILCVGNIIEDVLDAANKLDNIGISTKVVSFLTIKPINKDYVLKFAKAFGSIFTVEEHNIIGGIGTVISEIIMESDIQNIFFRRIGINDDRLLEIGTQKYLKEINGISSEGIMEQIKLYLNEK